MGLVGVFLVDFFDGFQEPGLPGFAWASSKTYGKRVREAFHIGHMFHWFWASQLDPGTSSVGLGLSSFSG